MSSCFSGGGRAYAAFELDIVKSSSTSTRTSQTSSSPSSTLSESSNSAIVISTRKPRTPRKRPNQTFNEAAALLSTAYPNIFSNKIMTIPRKSTRPHDAFLDPSAELLFPFRSIDNSTAFLLDRPVLEKPNSRFEPKLMEKLCHSPGEFNSPVTSFNLESNSNSMELCNDDFDAESMLDEEIEEGIDSIMGSSSSTTTTTTTTSMNIDSIHEYNSNDQTAMNSCYGYPMGLGFGGNFGFGFGLRRGGVRPLRQVDDGSNWWRFPTVDVHEISPRFNESRPSAAPAPAAAAAAGKKKKKKMERLAVVESKLAEMKEVSPDPSPNPGPETKEADPGLMLKLDYDDVLNAWSDKASPFSEEMLGGADGNDVSARLAQIDLFSDAGGLREASVLRYKEKRRTRLFSKKIRYQVRKVNADRRPRMKGRFVRRPNSSNHGQRQKEII